jgi:hypothetical protein
MYCWRFILPLKVSEKKEQPPSHEELAFRYLEDSKERKGRDDILPLVCAAIATAEALLAINDTLKKIKQEIDWSKL